MPDAPDPIPTVLLVALFLVLAEIVRAFSSGTLLAPQPPRRTLQFDWVVLLAAASFILLNLIPVLLRPFFGGPEPEPKHPPTNFLIVVSIFFNFAMLMVLLAVIPARQKNRLTDYGIDRRGWLAEVRYGGLGFLACLPFVILVMGLVSRWRSPDTQNALLILLRQAGNEWTIVGVVFTAVVSAPLTEELLFRVAFQGSLETRLPLPWAIGIPAVIFASVHGRYDALPLLPLAIVLGVLYHLRRSYVACVTTHAMFNATFLVLALWQRQAS
jgi:membrane protease YdiL (CAAX protease family)